MSDFNLQGRPGFCFGLPFLLETASLEEACALCKEEGLNFVELNSNFPACLLSRLDAGDLLRFKERYGCQMTLHLDDALNPFDFNDLVREGSLKTVLKAISLARAAGIPLLNLHFPRGNIVTLPDGKHYIYREYPEEFERTLLEFRSTCERAAGGEGGPILSIENTDGWENYELEAIRFLLQSPVFGLTLDIGHDFAVKGQDLPFFLENKSRLCHMHAHDGWDKTNHQALGTGKIPLEERLNLARDCGASVVLETKTRLALGQSTAYLRGKGLL